MQDLNGLLKSLHRLKVETGSLACLGCGREHSCTTKGCATCRHDKAVGYDEAPCTCCMRGEKWEWKGPKT